MYPINPQAFRSSLAIDSHLKDTIHHKPQHQLQNEYLLASDKVLRTRQQVLQQQERRQSVELLECLVTSYQLHSRKMFLLVEYLHEKTKVE
jgi:hypothetical protein